MGEQVKNILYVLPSVGNHKHMLQIDAVIRQEARRAGVRAGDGACVFDDCRLKERPVEGDYRFVLIGLDGGFDDWKPLAHSRFVQRVKGDLGEGFRDTPKFAVPLRNPRHGLAKIARELTRIAGDNSLDGVMIPFEDGYRVITPDDPRNYWPVAYLL